MIDISKLPKSGTWFICVKIDSTEKKLSVTSKLADISTAQEAFTQLILTGNKITPKPYHPQFRYLLMDSNALEFQKKEQRETFDLTTAPISELKKAVLHIHSVDDLISEDLRLQLLNGYSEILKSKKTHFGDRIKRAPEVKIKFKNIENTRKNITSNLQRTPCKEHEFSGNISIHNWATLIVQESPTGCDPYIDYYNGLAEAARLPIIPPHDLSKWDQETSLSNFRDEVKFLWKLHSKIACLGGHHMHCNSFDTLTLDTLKTLIYALNESNTILSMIRHGMADEFSENAKNAWVKECDKWNSKILGSNWVLWDHFKENIQTQRAKNPLLKDKIVAGMFEHYGDLCLLIQKFQTGEHLLDSPKNDGDLSILDKIAKAWDNLLFGNIGALNASFDNLNMSRIMDYISAQANMNDQTVAILSGDKKMLQACNILERYTTAKNPSDNTKISLILPYDNTSSMTAWSASIARIESLENSETPEASISRFQNEAKLFFETNIKACRDLFQNSISSNTNIPETNKSQLLSHTSNLAQIEIDRSNAFIETLTAEYLRLNAITSPEINPSQRNPPSQK